VAELAPVDSVETLVHRADVALYQAKLAGRDRCTVLPVNAAPPDTLPGAEAGAYI
jgi:predicted signal transduction protein with EAL and GGDEF domain